MELTCYYNHKFNVRGAFYGLFPTIVGRCPQCGFPGKPNEKGRKELVSRSESIIQPPTQVKEQKNER